MEGTSSGGGVSASRSVAVEGTESRGGVNASRVVAVEGNASDGGVANARGVAVEGLVAAGGVLKARVVTACTRACGRADIQAAKRADPQYRNAADLIRVTRVDRRG